ncbi:hypothetical protein L3Y34_002445 [Caenorhabditis briggsae]|uniref:Protein kinase domain-containing protein n=1 Tax=Caenorhabditis briggsae TaxID=6238 RepID=A0AAE9IRQ1_CAEBR|nr:hypothetical protein L3Y34_002445 [Caenorhabditis briggsae]
MSAIDSSEFSEYQIRSSLGKGAFGEVSMIRTRTSRFCAMKEFSKEKAYMAKNEFEIHSLVGSTHKHQNVCEIFAMTEENGLPRLFLEMAYCGDLSTRTYGDGMPVQYAQKYFRQLIAGLEHVHGLGVAHLDIKPLNLLIKTDGTLKISDFGLSVKFIDDEGEKLWVRPAGTPAYWCPEGMVHKYIDGEAADIWSAGICLVEMLIGDVPWEEPTEKELQYETWLMNDDMDWDIDDDVFDLLERILEVDTPERANIKEIKNDAWFQKDYSYLERKRTNKRKQPKKKSLADSISSQSCASGEFFCVSRNLQSGFGARLLVMAESN